MPMPTVKQTEDFYDMLVAAARRKRARLGMDAAPVGTPPDAPGGNYTGKLITALHAWAASELTPEQTAALNHLIEDATDQRGAVAKDDEPARKADPEKAEAAMDFLRSKGIDEKDVDWIRKAHFGLEKPSMAADSARRARHADDYAKTFPNAARIVGDAAVRVRPVNTSASARASYDAMFPDAARLG